MKLLKPQGRPEGRGIEHSVGLLFSHPFRPITWPPPQMHHREDDNEGWLDGIEETKRKAFEYSASNSVGDGAACGARETA